MKRIFLIIALIFSVMALSVVSCKKDDPKPEPTPAPIWYSPEPTVDGCLPTSVLPNELSDSVRAYFNVYEGNNPNIIEDGQFVSSPHVIIHTIVPNDTVPVYNDRYVAFFKNGDFIDFYGKQWDDEAEDYYEEAYRRLYVIGEGENFTCYYLTEGYPDGMYAKYSTVFSGKWNESYGGLKDFQVAVIMLETSGNPHLAPVGSFRVLGDGDGLAENDNWMDGKRTVSEDKALSTEDAFRMFRIK